MTAPETVPSAGPPATNVAPRNAGALYRGTAEISEKIRYFLGGTGLPPGSTAGGGKRSLRICKARIAA